MRPLLRIATLALSMALGLALLPASALASNRVNSVAFSDASNGLIGGGLTSEAGFVSYTNNGGVTFHSRLLGRNITSVAARGATGIAAPNGGAPFISNSWATGWPLAPVPDVSASKALILPGGRVLLAGNALEYNNKLGVTARIGSSVDGGATWQSVFDGPIYPMAIDASRQPRTNSEFLALDADTAGNVVWASGREQAELIDADGVSSLGYTFAGPLVKKSVNGGSTFETVTVPTIGSGYPVTALAVGSPDVVFAGSWASMYTWSTNGGATWATPVAIPSDASNLRNRTVGEIQDMDARGTKLLAVGNKGKIAWSANGATNTWSFKDLGLPGRVLRGAAMLSDTSWVVVGDEETVLRTNDAGATWSGTTSTQPPLVSITGPGAGFSLSGAPVTILGTSSDAGVGVASVEVRIRRADGRSWNHISSSWETTESWVPATSSDGWATWAASWTPDAGLLASGQLVTITARATDGMRLQTLSTAVTSGSSLGGSVSISDGAPYTSSPLVNATLYSPGATEMRWQVGAGAWTAWTPFVTSTPVNLGTGDGTKTVTFEFRNEGTTSAPIADTIQLHTSLPTVALTAPASGFSLQPGAVTISGTAADLGGTVSDVKVRIRRADGQTWDGGAWTASEAWLPVTSSNGYATWTYSGWNPNAVNQVVTITARAVDMSGLTGTSGSVVSAMPINVTASVVLGGGASYATTTSVSASVITTGATYMRWSGDVTNPSSAWTAVGSSVPLQLTPGDGTKTVTFEFSANASTVATTASDTIVLHTSIPQVSVVAPSAGFALASTPVTISGTASDVGGTVAKVEVRIRRADGRTWSGSAWVAGDTWLQATGTSNWSRAWTADADVIDSAEIVSVTARATDAVGLSSETSATNSSPGVPRRGSISLDGGAPYASTNAVQASIAFSGVTHMRWRGDVLQPSEWVPVAASQVVTLSAGSGTKTVTFDFSPDGSTVATSASDSIVMDASAPTVAFAAPAAGFTFTGAEVAASGTVADTGGSGLASSTVEYQVRRSDGLTWRTDGQGGGWDSGDHWTAMPLDGSNWSFVWTTTEAVRRSGYPVTLMVRAADNAGGATTTAVTSVNPLDPAAITLTTGSSTIAYGGTGYVRGRVEGEDGPLGSVVVQLWRGGKYLRSVATNGLGEFAFTDKPTVKYAYQVKLVQSPTRAGAVSNVIYISPKAYLTRPSGPTAIRAKYYFTSTGYLKPRHTAGSYPVKIRAERYENGKWVLRKVFNARASNYSSYTKYTARVALPLRGRWRIIAYHADAAHAATLSSARYVTAK